MCLKPHIPKIITKKGEIFPDDFHTTIGTIPTEIKTVNTDKQKNVKDRVSDHIKKAIIQMNSSGVRKGRGQVAIQLTHSLQTKDAVVKGITKAYSNNKNKHNISILVIPPYDEKKEEYLEPIDQHNLIDFAN